LTRARWLCAAGLCALLALSAASRYTPPPAVVDMFPQPDAIEYAASARQLLEHGRFVLPLNGVALPPKVSFGFPLLIIPAYLIAGHAHANAIWAVLALQLVEVLLVFWLAARLCGRWAALAAAALVVASPLDASLSQLIMSDLAASVAIVASLVALAREELRVRDAAIAGLLAAAAFAIRIGALFYLPALIGLCAWVAGERRRAATVAFAAGWGLGVAPVAIYNWVALGSPFKTGYQIRSPLEFASLGGTFALGHALERGKAASYLAGLAGLHGQSLGHDEQLYSPSVALLALGAAAIALRARDRGARFAGGAWALIVTTLALYLFYYWPSDLRMLHLAVPLTALLAAYALREAFRRLPQPWALVASCALLAPVAVTLVGVVRGRVERQETIAQRNPFGRQHERMQAVLAHTEPDAWIVTNQIDVSFFGAEAGGRSLMRSMGPAIPTGVLVESFQRTPERLAERLAAGAHAYYLGPAPGGGGGDHFSLERVPTPEAPDAALWRVGLVTR